MNPLIAFLSGVGVSLVAAVVASLLTRARERRKQTEERRFEIYMKLMELHGIYFWFSSAEVRRKPIPPEIRQRCRSLAWEIADILRAADEMEYLDEIIEVLLGPSFNSALERYGAMGQLLGKLGHRVNPRYQRKIREISEANVCTLAAGEDSNAPGAMWP